MPCKDDEKGNEEFSEEPLISFVQYGSNEKSFENEKNNFGSEFPILESTSSD
ncbi:hypothetical protein FACS189472_13340 [Alphaproteobacteria bacterium]|nr:hypothetical protein FACS189472_13340 [Alphaproteobacteria bacterium]